MSARREAEHIADVELGGGRAQRSPKLRVLPEVELGDWHIEPGVPRTRGDCASVPRPCPYVKCRHHLWLVEAESRPGRRHANGSGPTSTLAPMSSSTCTLDVAATVSPGDTMTYGEIGAHLGVSDERARLIFNSAARKLASLGYTIDDLLALRSER